MSNFKKDLGEILKKLFTVKSIVTFALIGVTCYCAITNNISLSGEFFAGIVGSVITYYFTKQENK